LASPIQDISSVPLTLGNEAQQTKQRRHARFLRNLQQKEAVDQSSLMKQFMSSFSRNMKKAILEDSRGDMDEGERLRQLDALHEQEAPAQMPARMRGDDDADRLSQGLEPRSWSHAQPAADPSALADFAEQLQRGFPGLAGRSATPQEVRENFAEEYSEELQPGLSGRPREVREPPSEEREPSRERVGLLNGHRHHAHRAMPEATMPEAHSAAMASALFLVVQALLL
jgi:hypothetical protein